MIVEGERLAHELTVNLTQEAESVTGRVLWGDIEMRIVSGSLKGNDILLRYDWSEGKMELEGAVMGDRMKGNFRAWRRNEPEPYRGALELNRH
jgi:hypothetical protein